MKRRNIVVGVMALMMLSLVSCESKKEETSDKKEVEMSDNKKEDKSTEKDENVSTNENDSDSKDEKEDDKSDDMSYEEFMRMEETPGSEFNYRILDDGTIQVGYQGDAKYLVIPEEIDGMTVTSLRDGFYQVHPLGDGTYLGDIEGVKGVRLPDTLKEIPANAFSCNEQLEYLVLGNSLESVGDFAFRGCKSIKELTLPDTLKTIGAAAFAGIGAEEIVVPESVTYIDDNAFECDNLKEITIENYNCEIHDGAFSVSAEKPVLKICAKAGGTVEAYVKELDEFGLGDYVCFEAK